MVFPHNTLKKKWVIELTFLIQIMHSNLQQIDTLMVKHFQVSQNSKFAVFLQYLKKEVSNEVDFFACRYTSKFSTSWFQHCYKVKQSLLMRMIKHSKSTQCNIFAISFQQYQKKLWMEFIFFMQININASTSWHYHSWWKRPYISKVAKIGIW